MRELDRYRIAAGMHVSLSFTIERKTLCFHSNVKLHTL